MPRWKLLELGGWYRNLPRLSGRGWSPSIRKSMEPSIPGPTFPIFFGTRRGPTGPWPLQAISGHGICYLCRFPGTTTPPALSPRCTGAVGPPDICPECRRGKRLALGDGATICTILLHPKEAEFAVMSLMRARMVGMVTL